MTWYRECKLAKDQDGYVVEIYVNLNPTEFSDELLTNVKENIEELDNEIKKIIKEKFPDVKVNVVKLMLGTLVVGTLTFVGDHKVKAADFANPNASTTAQQADKSNLSIIKVNTTGTVSATRLNVRNGASTSYSIISKLPQGSRVKVIGILNGWCQVQLSDGRIGWVSKQYLRLDIETTSRQERINRVIYTAKSLLGTPYVWGGDSKADGGFDCSGFTQYIFKGQGYILNRVSIDQAKQGRYVARENLQSGDLVFYSLSGDGRISHVGIYIGGGKMIHSPKTGDVVKTTDITTGYWQSRFITAKRIM